MFTLLDREIPFLQLVWMIPFDAQNIVQQIVSEWMDTIGVEGDACSWAFPDGAGPR
jgi:hypothetical protein